MKFVWKLLLICFVLAIGLLSQGSDATEEGCSLLKEVAMHEYETFDRLFLYTMENGEVIWKLTEKNRKKLFYKYEVLVDYANCLEGRVTQ
ncbi:MAG: hypothetical protein Unbinned7913contig1002_3 [Prokaryotic dsDNA virus sp.]|jgi:hypothetical protein|nr:MAG: hypothetical protein Unbinned7913contig1002_3 [Prokaryotic dsDNA virus sp.]|tara:strand:+ start:6237 stop:6506 length:270 start_codon:yes stop_codon:yes gene_type:complete